MAGGGAVVVLGLLALSSCSGSSTSAADPVVATGLARDLTGTTDAQALHDFGERRTARCMAAAAQPYATVPFDAVDATGLGFAATREERAARGFGIAGVPDAEVAVAPDPNVELVDSLDDEARDRYLATLDGCRAEAEAELDRRRRELRAALTDADARHVDRIVAGTDPHGRPALAAWSACMADTDVDATDPGAMLAELEATHEALVASGASAEQKAAFARWERSVALADADCTSEHLEPALEAAVRELAERLGDRYGVTDVLADEWTLREPGS